MRIRIDFQLNRQFGVVENIIFRLVLNGFTDSREIAKALSLFSDSIIANGIKLLVNHQIMAADIEAGKLYLSEPLIAIIDMCLENTYEIDVPSELEGYIKGDGLMISGIADEESYSLKSAVLFELLPGIRLDMYMDSIDFVLCEERGVQHE
ncbi:hypothetical protein SAMN02745229_03346 [Butyrivibrio fibrisolvens DSM 3071]|uniref:Uncharacterized protein n=1 Tax=Butyrivibrio fibrisolvens DSM 3071 TaxID=1121131 RepID=A0A1M6CHN0_BUTFI|nr:hypothetical protein [Butyrivibrio fibrisolvens]SHI60264.1 hypothetical protein SAMN02745229_03346 [Butyrivibrio fibrisolvens DSM 3071]